MLGRGGSGVGNPEISDSERRHADVVKFGVVQEADYAGARVRVLIGDEDDDEGHLVSGWLPMAGTRAKGDFDWHPLEVGERVLVLSESGELQNGIVIPAALYSDDNPAPGAKAGLWRKTFQDGGKVEYDRDTGEFLVDAKSKATLKVGSDFIRIEAGKVTLTAGGVTLEVSSGGVSVTGGSVTHDGKNMGKDHKHLGVTAGSAQTGNPV